VATVAAVRTALKDRLAAITTLRVHDVMPDALVSPAAVVRPLSGVFASAHGGSPTTTFEVIVIVPLSSLQTGQRVLDPYLEDTGSSSIYATIRADQTLGAVVRGTQVAGWRDYGSLVINGVEYLGARVDVEVMH